MAAAAMATNEKSMLEHNRISPANSSCLGNKSFPISYFDLPWVPLPPIHQLFFHELPHPKSHLLQIIIPNLKHSLSVTLQHFFPLAGNLILFPFTDPTSVPSKPEIRYVNGDSVSFTVAESRMDFVHLTKDHTRKANDLYHLFPKMGDLTRDNSDNTIRMPLLALQVTLFPNHGICIGMTSHHVLGDAIASMSFLRAWGSITQFGNDKPFLSNGSLPILDRSIIKDPSGIATRIWSQIVKTQFQETPPAHISGNDDLIRASFIMTKDQIDRIKKSIAVHGPSIARKSSFTIVCAHFWTCLAKARDSIGERDKKELVFGCVAECRSRLDPPLPATYFGNCVVSLQANATHDQLVGEEGFFDAVELIGDSIQERLKNKESIDAGIDALGQEFCGFPTTVAGSPKFDFYDTDFGWGRPIKHELVPMHYSFLSALSLNPSGESGQDIGIELSLPKVQMDVLEHIFIEEIEKIIVLTLK